MKSVHKIAAATQQKCSRFFTKDIATNGTRAKENILNCKLLFSTHSSKSKCALTQQVNCRIVIL